MADSKARRITEPAAEPVAERSGSLEKWLLARGARFIHEFYGGWPWGEPLAIDDDLAKQESSWVIQLSFLKIMEERFISGFLVPATHSMELWQLTIDEESGLVRHASRTRRHDHLHARE